MDNTQILTPTRPIVAVSGAAQTDELLDWIEGRCAHMAASATGLDEAQLRARPLPSGWSVLGLLGHVRESTVFWLRHVVVGEPFEAFTEDDEPWDNDPAATGAEILAGFLAETSAACAAVRGLDADAAPGWWPEGAWGGYRQDTIRGVLLHLYTDNAAHSGQLDIVRELADGGVWDFMIDGVRVPA